MPLHLEQLKLIVKELQKQNELLEKLTESKPQEVTVLREKNTLREKSTRRSNSQ